MKIAFLLYPTEKVKVDEDSSFWIFHELRSRGHRVYAFESRDMKYHQGELVARLTTYRTGVSSGYGAPHKDARPTSLGAMDVIFIRKEPPFDNEYLYTLQMLKTMESQVFILNRPSGIALCNEKLFTTEFPEFIPESMITTDALSARAFVKDLGVKAVVKPLNQKGGAGIFFTTPGDRNLPSLLESATGGGAQRIIVQRFIPHDKEGDKRILLLDGEFIGCFLRKPSRADFRANLGVGGTFHRSRLSVREKKLIEAMRPKLAQNGLYFVGLDVIRGYLSEVNVTSPSGIPELYDLQRLRLERVVADFIELGR